MFYPPVSIYHSDIKRMQPGEISDPLIFEENQFHYVTEGCGIVRAGSKEFCVKAGELFLTFPFEEFSYEATGTDPWEFYQFTFGGADASFFCDEIGFSPETPVFVDDDELSVKKALFSLWEVLPEQPGKKYEVISRFYALIAQFKLKENKNYVEKAKDYIHSRFPFPIRIEQIAQYVGLDRTYLFKLFVKEEGISPQEYLIRYRLERAQFFLSLPDLPVAQIAASCGFGDAPSFCKHFKARFGCTPTAFRNGKKD